MTTSIYTSQTPGFPDENNGAGISLGVLFTSSLDGTVNGIRWYFPATTITGGSVIGLLYSYDSETTGTELARATFSSPTAGTWNTVTFSSPVAITATTRYVASVWSPNRYVASAAQFASAISNSPLTAPADDGVTPRHNGRFNTLNSADNPVYPAGSFGSGGYFVDVVFDSSGPQTVSPTGLTSAEAFGTTVVTPGAVTVSPSGLTTAGAFGSGTLAGPITCTGIASAQAFGVPTLTGGLTGAPSGDMAYELNRLAHTTGLELAGAANVWAGTSGLELVGALNSKAGTSGLDLQGACNALAGTTGLGPVLALSRVAA